MNHYESPKQTAVVSKS